MANEDREEVVVTPAGIAQYPSLLKPDTKFDELGVYKVNLILSAEDAAPIIKTLQEMLAEKKAELEDTLNADQIEALGKGTLPYSREFEEDKKTPTGNIIFKFKTKAAFVSRRDGKVIEKEMVVVDAKKNRMHGVAVGGGSKIKVSATYKTYYTAAIGVGVSARLGAVQVLELREYQEGGAAASMFGEEDGFETETVADFDTPAPAGSAADL